MVAGAQVQEFVHVQDGGRDRIAILVSIIALVVSKLSCIYEQNNFYYRLSF